MVRHERRSMAATAISIMCAKRRKARCLRNSLISWFTLLVCLVQFHNVTLAFDDAELAHYANEADVAGVGRTAHEPRFGERLLPLRKKSNVNISGNNRNLLNKSLNQNNHAIISVSTEKSVNSLLKRSNYIVSQDSDIKVRSNNKQVTNIKHNSDHNSLGSETEAFTLSVAALEEQTLETITPATTRKRQAKQLSRREDINVAEAVLVANVSKADRLVEMSTEFFVVPTSSTLPPASTLVPSRTGSKARGLPNFIQPSVTAPGGPRSVLIVAPKTAAGANSTATPPTIISTHLNFTGLRKEPWVVPVLVLASLTMLMMAAFEIFVLFKAWRTSPSRRHLFLGQMLLLGLFACAGLGAIITAQPSLLTCGTIRFGVGVAYALVFAALLVKCVFLISLNGGVYLPAPYQGLLLLFAVLIQVAIGAQWLITSPPELFTLSVPFGANSLLASTMTSQSDHTSSSSSFASMFHASASTDMYARITTAGTVLIPLCKTQFSEFLFSLIYIIFLIVFVSVLAIKSRGIRDNYREATYIGLAIGGAIPIWLGWMLCGLAVAERHKDACIAFGLVATSATVFLVMFMPKGRQLAAMGKEGLYVEDREEQFSSLSRGGSGYSPSFFHFKPIKYGVMGGGGGGFQNSASNSGNGVNMKHSSNGLNAGDRVALVTAAPPSYTRMYHYFPAHLTTHPFCFYPQPPPPPPLAPPTMTQLPAPPTLKQLGNSLSSMTQAHIAQTLRYPGLFIRPDETNLYTTLEPTLSSNPNVYFQRGGAVHPGMMY
ncbi:uncharacterized protein LOC111687615 isoform X1 [Lucilia cuprina]|uniref:uncharacterized protein LOC111687615 isoform X1 n=1 Tax=Lucilia cuprina TaxID=7375 RepID=UPI001F05D9C7|nr:uncharacterized protein LOC111687615 isoform X1 [Lucilia cuprina]